MTKTTIALVLALVGLASISGASPPARPNLVLIVVDDLGWADSGCFGNTFHETPSIDRLCREGMRFTSAYASGPNCSPSRAALISGRYPAKTGVTTALDNEVPDDRKLLEAPQKVLGSDEITIAEALRDTGYATASIGKWHLGGPPNDAASQGFSVSVGGGEQGRTWSYFYPFGYGQARIPVAGKPGDFLDDNLTDEAIRFLRDNSSRPFFLLLSFYAVHVPIQGKPELVAKYRAKPGSEQNDPVYAAMIESVDADVGRILATLDELELADRTLVVLTSDNGGMEGMASMGPLRGGKGSLHEGGLRVPLIARLRGMIPPRTSSDVPIAMIDLYPTFLDLAGGSTKQPLDGEDLTPVLRGSETLARDALYWHFPHYLPRGKSPAGAIRAGSWKLIESFETGDLELYDLAADEGEQHDLAKEKPERAAELRAKLAAWRETSGAIMPRPNPVYHAETPPAEAAPSPPP